jgi:anti-sigma factor RsiW
MSQHPASEQLSLYLDDEVRPQEARRIERHLEACGECRERLDGLRRVVDGLRTLRPVAPPRSLALELQKQLARATPPFGDRSPLGRHGANRVLPTAVLASLAVVLALAVIMLLLLLALEGRSGTPPSVAPGRSPEAAAEASAIVGGRSFRRTAAGWVESSITPAEAAAARAVSRTELESATLPADVRRALAELDGELTLRLGDEAVRVSRD